MYYNCKYIPFDFLFLTVAIIRDLVLVALLLDSMGLWAMLKPWIRRCCQVWCSVLLMFTSGSAKWNYDMADSKNFKDVGLNNESNPNTSSTPSSDFDRLEDCNEAEFRGATLSLSQEISPVESTAGADSELFFNAHYIINLSCKENFTSVVCLHMLTLMYIFFNYRKYCLFEISVYCISCNMLNKPLQSFHSCKMLVSLKYCE